MTLLEKALIDLSKILFENRIRYMVIGGMGTRRGFTRSDPAQCPELRRLIS